MIQLSEETLSYKTRPSGRDVCEHCRKFDSNSDQEHRCCFDPNLGKWIEICLKCGMVDLAENP